MKSQRSSNSEAKLSPRITCRIGEATTSVPTCNINLSDQGVYKNHSQELLILILCMYINKTTTSIYEMQIVDKMEPKGCGLEKNRIGWFRINSDTDTQRRDN